MKLLPLAVALAVLAATGATIWMGALTREETVVDQPYEEGLRYDEARRARRAEEQERSAPTPAARVARAEREGGRAPGDAVEAACDLGAAPCAATLGDLQLTVDLGPRPIAPMRSLSVNVELRRAGAPVDGAEVTASFAMAGMQMGENAVALAPAGAGRYAGTAVLVRCPSGRRDWIATIDVQAGGAARRAELALRVAE